MSAQPAARSACPRTMAWTRGVACGLVLTLAVLARPAQAADDNQIIFPGASKREAPAAASRSSWSSITLVVGLLCAATGGWLVWRNRRTPGMSRDARLLAIDETRSLGNRQYLVVASYDGQKFLLGVCPGRIDMLSPLGGASGEKVVRRE